MEPETLSRCIVAEKREVADSVVRLELSAHDGGPLPAWEPGAHVDLHLTPSLTRQYSLCSDPRERRQWSVAVLREPHGRGGSAYVHDSLEAGAEISVGGPRNHFPLLPSPRYRFLAGGIGITPILPMIAAADQAGGEWELLYGGRRRDSMAFVAELEAYGDRVQVRPEDEFGMLDLELALAHPEPETLVYCCGPAGLLDAVERHCEGWPIGALRTERFTPKSVSSDHATSFEIELRRSGLTLTVPADRSILDVCLEAGVEILASCEEGTCGTCQTSVLEGEVEHRDSVLSPEERAAAKTMMVCVSRARSRRLVLDA